MKPSSASPNFFTNWGTVTHGLPQGSISGPLFFVMYINDLPSTIRTLSEPIIFTDDTSVIISNKSIGDFWTLANSVLSHMSEWFTVNKLVEKTKIMKFATNNAPQCALSIRYNGKYIEESANTKFHGLQSDNHQNWKNNIDQMILKLSVACYVVRSVFYIVSIDTLKSVYFAYFHSIKNYEIIFWGNSQ
jgi:hypothetical protein